MNIQKCFNCAYSNTIRQNDLGEIRCEKFHTFVHTHSSCDYYCEKGIEKLVELIRGDTND